MMDLSPFSWLPLDGLQAMSAALDNDLLVAGLFFLATATLIGMSVPGVLIPMAIGSGALLGPLGASVAVTLGAMAGSQLFFVAARHLARERLQARLGSRLVGFESRFARHGLLYLVGLRLIGAPQFLVAGGSALTSIRASSFAAATMVGLLPAITIAAATGSVI